MLGAADVKITAALSGVSTVTYDQGTCTVRALLRLFRRSFVEACTWLLHWCSDVLCPAISASIKHAGANVKIRLCGPWLMGTMLVLIS